MSLDNAKRSRPLDQPPPASSRKATRTKPAKPYPDFPLFPHATGRWAKKIRGKFVFFGPWEDPFRALDLYVSQRDALHAGLVARPAGGGPSRVQAQAGGAEQPLRASRQNLNGRGPRQVPLAAGPEATTLRDLVNRFLTAKQRLVDAGELSPRSFRGYHETAAFMLTCLRKDRRVDDVTTSDLGVLRAFLARGRGPVSLGTHIQRVRTMFKYAYDEGLLDRPVRFGMEFCKPSRKSLRHARNERPARMFEPGEIKALLASAGVQMRAMILLGLNAAMGNTDVATLPRSAVNLMTGVIEFPRPKTGIPRRAILWPETVGALMAALAVRPKPKEDSAADLVFVTKYGKQWVRCRPAGPRSKLKVPEVTVDSVGLEFGKLMRAVGVAKPGRSFYALRHTFRTVADEVNDRPAIDRLMGHENGADIAVAYVERISDERLRKVTDHVRGWLGPF